MGVSIDDVIIVQNIVYSILIDLIISNIGPSVWVLYIGCTPIRRDSCYLDPKGKARGMINSMNPDKWVYKHYTPYS